MSQLVLDDQLDVQILLPGLETWITAVRLQALRPGEHVLDERVPEVLQSLKTPTFVTIDHGFWNRRLAVNEHLFPYLVSTGYQVTSSPDPIYNCIAYAAGITDTWWWPDPDGFDYWPPGVPRERTLPAFIQAFAVAGYMPCPDGSFEAGWEKVAIYGRPIAKWTRTDAAAK